MRTVHNHAEAVHLGNDLRASSREASMPRSLRLNVAELVDTIVDELDGAHAQFEEPRNLARIALEGVGSFQRNDSGRPLAASGVGDIARRLEKGQIPCRNAL